MDLAFRDHGVLDRPIAEIMSPPMPMIGIGEPVARVVDVPRRRARRCSCSTAATRSACSPAPTCSAFLAGRAPKT